MNKRALDTVALLVAAGCIVLLCLSGCAKPAVQVEKYPTKPITVICPWAAGGSTDMVARVAAGKLTEKWGVPVNVVDKPGGNGIPATVEVLGASPDGYTVLAEADGSSSVVAAWGKDVPFDIRERTYLAKVAEFPWAFIVPAASPWNTLNDVAEAIRKDPAKVTWGWLGGTAGADVPVGQFFTALAKQGVNISDVKMVTFQGGTQTATAVAGGHVDIGVGSTTSVGPMYRAGKIKILAITGQQRFKHYPEIPSTVEQGWTTVTFRGAVGFSGPKGLSETIIKKWEEDVRAVVEDPALAGEWDKIQAEPSYLDAEGYREYVLRLADEIKGLVVGGGGK